MSIHKRSEMSREYHAISRWNEMQNSWSSFKKRISKQLGKNPEDLVISLSDDYREMIEEYNLLQKVCQLF
jgi:hypothetical protein